jgi:hypothetical protein
MTDDLLSRFEERQAERPQEEKPEQTPTVNPEKPKQTGSVQIDFHVTSRPGQVLIGFSRTVKSMALPPVQALQYALAIMTHATNQLTGQGNIAIPELKVGPPPKGGRP